MKNSNTSKICDFLKQILLINIITALQLTQKFIPQMFWIFQSPFQRMNNRVDSTMAHAGRKSGHHQETSHTYTYLPYTTLSKHQYRPYSIHLKLQFFPKQPLQKTYIYHLKGNIHFLHLVQLYPDLPLIELDNRALSI